ncbi:hypothetical protein MRX96_002053 [Rhipicephalus microplus]
MTLRPDSCRRVVCVVCAVRARSLGPRASAELSHGLPMDSAQRLSVSCVARIAAENAWTILSRVPASGATIGGDLPRARSSYAKESSESAFLTPSVIKCVGGEGVFGWPLHEAVCMQGTDSIPDHSGCNLAIF